MQSFGSSFYLDFPLPLPFSAKRTVFLLVSKSVSSPERDIMVAPPGPGPGPGPGTGTALPTVSLGPSPSPSPSLRALRHRRDL